MITFHQRPTSSMWHLCYRDGDLKIRSTCHYRLHLSDAAARDLTTTYLDADDIATLLDTRKINRHRVCDTCFRATAFAVKTSDLITLNVAPANTIIDFSYPVVVGPGGDMHQAEKKTIAAAKKLAKELAGDFGADFTVLVPHTTCGPVKPKIRETRHQVNDDDDDGGGFDSDETKSESKKPPKDEDFTPCQPWQHGEVVDEDVVDHIDPGPADDAPGNDVHDD